MEDLLTTRQVQDILKVDRITIYRMLQDGRLKGVKIGQQWRFPASEIEKLLTREVAPGNPGGAPPTAEPGEAAPAVRAGAGFPTHCVQVIQDLYAGLGKISAVTLDGQGKPLTTLSRLGRFCELVLSTPSGQAACQQAWESSIRLGAKAGWHLCHTGLRYQLAPITDRGAPVAYLLSGLLYLEAPDPGEVSSRVQRLARQHGLDPQALLEAAHEVQVVDAARRAEIESWPARFAQAIESILKERAGLVDRLQQIAEITQF